MAMTLLGVLKKDHETVETTYYLSQEYLPTKDKDALGNILPNQEWQHPVSETLSYCRLGAVIGTERIDDILKSLLTLGAGGMGGHIRIIFTEAAEWIEERVETLEDRCRREEQENAERYASYVAENQKEQRRAEPIYAYCRRCECSVEQCKGPNHRGVNRCMHCCGEIGDAANRICRNCLDLPWREKREQLRGAREIYEGEEAG
jgi:hypothetical protein